MDAPLPANEMTERVRDHRANLSILVCYAALFLQRGIAVAFFFRSGCNIRPLEPTRSL